MWTWPGRPTASDRGIASGITAELPMKIEPYCAHHVWKIIVKVYVAITLEENSFLIISKISIKTVYFFH